MRQQLEKTLSHVSQRAVKHWLKTRGLEHTAANTDLFYERLIKLIDNRSLSIDHLKNAAIEIEESGNKRIYLRNLQGTEAISSKSALRDHLDSLNVSLVEDRYQSIHQPIRPVLNYIGWFEQSPARVRMKFSETHEELEVNYETQTVTSQKITKFVVVVVDVESGFVQVRLDPASKVHPHKDQDGKSKEELYEDYYFRKAAELLGSEGLKAYDLSRAAEYLTTTQPRIFRLPIEKVRTSAASFQTYSSRRDVRDDPARRGAQLADGDNWVYEDLHGYWIQDESEGQLSREVFMQLKRRTSMLRFLADCLENEVEYAISRIRAI